MIANFGSCKINDLLELAGNTLFKYLNKVWAHVEWAYAISKLTPTKTDSKHLDLEMFGILIWNVLDF